MLLHGGSQILWRRKALLVESRLKDGWLKGNCLRRELLSCSQSQELSQWANLAPGWRIKGKRPIRGRLCSLTQLLTITATQKFPSLVAEGEKVVFVDVVQLQNVVVIQQAEIFGHNLLLLQPCENLIESYETFQSIIGVLFFNIFLTEVKTTM